MTADHKQCEWLGWFDRYDTDEALRAAAYQPAIPIQGLQQMSVEEACKQLDQAWEAIFVPGQQHLVMLHSLLDQARGFAMSMYPTLKDYNRLRCSSAQPVIAPQPIRCLTGLAGVSKSSLVQAFERICQLQPTADFLTDGQRLKVHPVRRVVINGQPAILGILRGMANPVALSGRARIEMAGLMGHVGDWLSATATSTLVVDEMQFFTQSALASTKTSQLIMTLANLGPPLVYVANYSLVRKFLLRPQEEKDRLLGAPMVLEPPGADDPLWSAAVQEYLSASQGTFKLDAALHALELHRYTGGLFRALRKLLLQAYREARAHDRHEVSQEDIKLAYRSREYSSHRKDVEDLASLAVSPQMAEKRPDLVCPFTEVHVGGTRGAVKPVLSRQQQPVPPLDAAALLIESTISTAAKARLRELRRAANAPPDERMTATVTRLPKRVQVSAQSLLQGAQVLRDVIKKPRSAAGQPSPQRESGDAETS
ncbi:MAG: hypothetical protein HGA75_01950 [Thiobacillus sp.]|nr:hypothetical protein [Thiobacillus sp.]